MSAKAPERDESLSGCEDMERALVALLGNAARSLVPRFVRAGISTLEAVETFVGWTPQEQRIFMKEDVGLTAFEAMDIVHRVARRGQ